MSGDATGGRPPGDSGSAPGRGRLRGVAVALGLAMTASLGGCSLAPSAGGERTMVVYVPKARSFYEESKVKVMGADVGLVDKVENQGDRVKVTFHLRRDVPLPKGVQASIVPLNLIGERNLVLHPAWRPGEAKETADVIPIERTHVPVEVDDALSSFTNLANALDPTKMQSALGTAADTVKGNGKEFNATLEQSARLVENVAGQDQELIEVARNLSRLAGVVRGREQILGTMIRDFGTASQVLSSERGELQQLISGILELARNGDKLLRKYKGNLPYDLAVLTRTALILKGNARELAQLIRVLPGISDALIGGYNPKNKSLQIRFATDAFLRTWLKGLMNSDDVECPLPAPNSNCPWQNGGN
ncbi:MCE family protein [Actinomadura luteofluorescens]|uniref:Virulence factor Mce-like protein n=1 Tax=Actinomadura luteofluorescens TaxID=46163 RepID=A0A7Y9JID1_9ACTN|nr:MULTISPECIES: MCE family protein [Actinomadura]MCR3741479.1 virulence factor Mce family protein [Actinomadura glauciflava]NYD49900.1 virulence factor Mce-like protein [Actinomadura luteofluorescens]